MTATTAYRLSYGDYLRFRQLILNRSGLHFPEKKRNELEIGIMKALRNAPNGITNINRYFTYLSQPSSTDARIETNRLIDILTIGETHFFRDQAQFNALHTHVLPALIKRKRASAAAVQVTPPAIPQLRIWCAGCATGEEPYSLALLLRQLIPDIQEWHILILGTDINGDSLSQARKGSYSNWSFREDRAKQARQEYFIPDGKRYRLREDVRRQVTFTRHNLIEDETPSTQHNIVAMDLIFCRNVTIYFTPEATRQLIQKFYTTLNDGGWLIVGHSEPSLITYRDFQTHTYPKAILYQKTGRSTPLPDDWSNLLAASEKPSNNGLSTSMQQQKNGTTPQKLLNDGTPLGKPQHPTQPKRMPLPSTKVMPVSTSTAPKKLEQVTPKQYEMAQSFLAQGKVDSAIQILEELIREQKSFLPTYCLLARTYANRTQWQKARFWSQEAIKQDPLQSEAYYILALVDENEGLISSSINNFRKVTYLTPDGPLPYFHLAILYKKDGQLTHARRALNNLIRILESWPPDKIVPESGDNARRLLRAAQQILREI